MTYQISVENIKCGGCASTIRSKLEAMAGVEKVDVDIVGLVRRGKRLPGMARVAEIQAGDILILEASPDSIEEALGALQLEYVGKGGGRLDKKDLVLQEVLVPESSRLAGR